MALAPCHWGWNITAIGEELNLFWVQRSCDLMLGVPFNIASYGLLLELLSKVAGLKAGNLSGMLVDCHIYENQIESANIQAQRTPGPLPYIDIPNNKYSSMELMACDVDQPPDTFDIFSWNHKQVELHGYNPQDKIDFGDVAV